MTLSYVLPPYVVSQSFGLFMLVFVSLQAHHGNTTTLHRSPAEEGDENQNPHVNLLFII
jgi:hypothetical protein